ncbi:MAG: VOC family protein, partial [Gammaproteobacteria bacterium]|nr:VOC family protein [Gammaproteobacteria bacterium]
MTNPPFLDLVPMLMCTDVQASIRFYTAVLGFEVTGRMAEVGATGF